MTSELLLSCQVQQLRDAEAILRKLIEIVPNHISAHYELGFALLQQRRSEEAIEHFRTTVKLHPQHAMAYYFLSLALVCNVQDFRGARQLLRELEELHPAEAKHLALLISLPVWLTLTPMSIVAETEHFFGRQKQVAKSVPYGLVQ